MFFNQLVDCFSEWKINFLHLKSYLLKENRTNLLPGKYISNSLWYMKFRYCLFISFLYFDIFPGSIRKYAIISIKFIPNCFSEYKVKFSHLKSNASKENNVNLFTLNVLLLKWKTKFHCWTFSFRSIALISQSNYPEISPYFLLASIILSHWRILVNKISVQETLYQTILNSSSV